MLKKLFLSTKNVISKQDLQKLAKKIESFRIILLNFRQKLTPWGL
jgi:t-SNARE complex subunit (syntaxin)